MESKYEDKLRKALTYLGEKVEWSLFHDQLARVISIWEDLKTNDDALMPIVNKWVRREKEITFLCFSVIDDFFDQIEKTFDIVSNLADFDNKRIHLQKIIIGYLNKYKS